MDDGEARAILGVGAGAAWTDVRAAYRRLVRAAHPDVAVDVPDAAARTARLTEAYATLRRSADPAAPAGQPAPPPAPPRARVAVALLDGDTIRLGAPRDEAFALLVEAGHGVGEVTYVDRSAGLLELVIEFTVGPVCSVVLTLQGRAVGTDAVVTVEPLTAGPPPPTAAVTALIARQVVVAGR